MARFLQQRGRKSRLSPIAKTGRRGRSRPRPGFRQMMIPQEEGPGRQAGSGGGWREQEGAPKAPRPSSGAELSPSGGAWDRWRRVSGCRALATFAGLGPGFLGSGEVSGGMLPIGCLSLSLQGCPVSHSRRFGLVTLCAGRFHGNTRQDCDEE